MLTGQLSKWLKSKHTPIDAGDLWFDSLLVKSDTLPPMARHSPVLRRFFAAVLPRRFAVEMGPATPLQRNTAKILKIMKI